MNQLPKEFVEKMENLLKDEAPAFFAAYDEERTAGLRINPLKIREREWLKIAPFSLEKIPFAEGGYYYSYHDAEPGKHPYHQAGLYYIQEPSAMFIAGLLDVKPGERVLDLCAAPGGKTTQLGAKMENSGLLIANEINPKRARALSVNIERFGLTNTIITSETPEKLMGRFPGFFDKILVDAPCSGEGMFRKDPGVTAYWSKRLIRNCTTSQRKILHAAYEMLSEGGTLVYSTCTFSPEEDEQMIEEFLKDHPDMELIEIPKDDGIEGGRREWTKGKAIEAEKMARLWPHKIRGEGHFAAKMRKTGPARHSGVKMWKGEKGIPKKPLQSFCQEFLKIDDFGPLSLFGDVLHQLPEPCPDLSGLKVVRAGLHIGKIKRDRLEPDHALAMALKKDDVRSIYNIPSGDERWERYLRGETLFTTEGNGWTLVCVDGFPLGWGKASQGILKNYYPKGLRMR
jgi:NOL1/NOP2/sun family putative RNA methylase